MALPVQSLTGSQVISQIQKLRSEIERIRNQNSVVIENLHSYENWYKKAQAFLGMKESRPSGHKFGSENVKEISDYDKDLDISDENNSYFSSDSDSDDSDSYLSSSEDFQYNITSKYIPNKKSQKVSSSLPKNANSGLKAHALKLQDGSKEMQKDQTEINKTAFSDFNAGMQIGSVQEKATDLSLFSNLFSKQSNPQDFLFGKNLQQQKSVFSPQQQNRQLSQPPVNVLIKQQNPQDAQNTRNIQTIPNFQIPSFSSISLISSNLRNLFLPQNQQNSLNKQPQQNMPVSQFHQSSQIIQQTQIPQIPQIFKNLNFPHISQIAAASMQSQFIPNLISSKTDIANILKNNNDDNKCNNNNQNNNYIGINLKNNKNENNENEPSFPEDGSKILFEQQTRLLLEDGIELPTQSSEAESDDPISENDAFLTIPNFREIESKTLKPKDEIESHPEGTNAQKETDKPTFTPKKIIKF